MNLQMRRENIVMDISWVGATSILLVISVTLFLALPRFFQYPSASQIEAERFAEDICLDSQTGMEGEPLSHTARVCDFSKEPTNAGLTFSQQAIFTIRWKRVAIFGVGALSACTAFISGVFAIFTALGWGIPLGALTLTIFSLATLRSLAIRDAKIRGRRRVAENNQVAESEIVLQPRIQREKSPPSDEENLPLPIPSKPQKREQQIPVSSASKSLRYARTHHRPQRQSLEGTSQESLSQRQLPEEPFENSLDTWQPTPLPEPVYTDFELVRPDQKPSKVEEFKIPEPPKVLSGSSLDEILGRRRRP